jgi:N utilization substance protein B
MSRKKARDNAFKCVYELEFGKDENIDNILRNCYEENNVSQTEKDYIEKVVRGIKDRLEQIDSIILANLKNWSIDRIAKIDLAILRLAIYEIKYMEDIPEKVSANEAVELAKTYGNNDSKSFVNGLIAKVIESKEVENGTKEDF